MRKRKQYISSNKLSFDEGDLIARPHGFIRSEEHLEDAVGKLTQEVKSLKERYSDTKESKLHDVKNESTKKRPDEWPEEFKWDDENYNYLLIDGKHINFRGTRKSVFKYIVEQKGEWVSLGEIAKKLNKDKEYIKTVANQIARRVNNNYKEYLVLEPRNVPNKPSAYRAIAFLNPR